MLVLDFQKITKHSDREELPFKEIPKITDVKTTKVLPVPDVIYQYKESGVDDIQDRLDRAFGLLFEATMKKLSTKHD